MPRLPSMLTYNDLNGQEAIEILCDWFRQTLRSQPLLQPHLTLPMAKIGLAVHIDIDMYVGGTVPVASPPDHVDIDSTVVLSNDLSADRLTTATAASSATKPEHRESDASTIINAAPIPGGLPPDQIREQHGLAVPRPAYGPRETGSHLFLADIVESTERSDRQPSIRPGVQPDSPAGGRQGIVADGYQFSPEPATATPRGPQEQSIAVASGEILIDQTGAGRMRQGDMVVTAGSHIASKKKQGDQAGHRYGSVTGTYDAGPAGLAQPGRGGGGLYSDGRPRIAFGNTHKG